MTHSINRLVNGKAAFRKALAMTGIFLETIFYAVYFWPRVFSFLLKMTFKVLSYDFLGTLRGIPEDFLRMFQGIFFLLLKNFLKE